MTEINEQLQGLLAERVEKLPAWARDYIRGLERDVERAHRERDEARLLTAPDLSPAVLYPYSDIPVGLGVNPRVRFKVGPAESRGSEFIDAWSNKGSVFLMGSTQLVLLPCGSVHGLRVEVKRR